MGNGTHKKAGRVLSLPVAVRAGCFLTAVEPSGQLTLLTRVGVLCLAGWERRPLTTGTTARGATGRIDGIRQQGADADATDHDGRRRQPGKKPFLHHYALTFLVGSYSSCSGPSGRNCMSLSNVQPAGIA